MVAKPPRGDGTSHREEIVSGLGKARESRFTVKGGRRLGREYPEHPVPSCHALVRHGERLLLVERGGPPFEGYWGLPGGAVELGETVEEAVVREVLEETGLIVRPVRLLGHHSGIQRDGQLRVQWHYVILYFECELVGGSLQAGDDAAAAEWLTEAEARERLLTDAVERCLAWAGETFRGRLIP